jgi:hypothetical protein
VRALAANDRDLRLVDLLETQHVAAHPLPPLDDRNANWFSEAEWIGLFSARIVVHSFADLNAPRSIYEGCQV